MTNTLNSFRTIGMAAAMAMAWFGSLQVATADVVLTGDINELVNLGINAGFELPAQARADGESTSTRNIGPGWTYNHLGGISSNFGVADPSIAHYNNNLPGATPLPAPFEQLQIGFINLDPYTHGEIVSNPIGKLQAGQSYTLKVAVGGRNILTWPDIYYRVGLRASDGTDLGTFASATIDPGGTAATPNPTTIQELTYTLNAAAVPAYVGDEVSIVIGGYNTALIDGAQSIAFTQANFDNVRLTGVFSNLAPDEPLITINRASGGVTLGKTGTTNMSITGYSLTSVAGSFKASSWLNVSNNYDKNSAPTPGNGSVDSNDAWTILGGAGSPEDLSEANLESGGDGGVLSHSSPVNLGNAWLRTPYQDVVAKVSLADGSVIAADVQYTGAMIPSGDLTGDANITGADWTAFKNGQGTNFATLSTAEGYLKGDLNGDGSHDLQDFLLFRTAYDGLNGAGSFAALVAVPEPSSWLILITAISAAVVCSRRASRALAVVLLVAVAMLSGIAPARAQFPDIAAHWSFDASAITTDANGILTAADASGNHNATRTNAATGVLPINSVPGMFGEAAQFTNVLGEDATGASRLEIPNLTEIMGPTGGDFTVAVWANIPTTTVGQDNTILADWVTTNTYWFQLDNSSATTARPRGQIRDTDGTDIIASTLSAAQATAAVGKDNLADGLWHHYAWVYTKAAGTMGFYVDSVLANTVTTANADHDVRTSGNANAHIGWKQDSNDHFSGTMDELIVFDGALDQALVTDLFQNNVGPPMLLTLRVDPLSGRVQLHNDNDGNATPDAITFTSYRITSAGNSLDESGWTPIAEQTVAGFPAGNGSGNGWEAGPGSDDDELAEWFLTGQSTLNKGGSIDLGFAYDESVDAQDLDVQYLLADGSLRSAKVIYGAIGGVPGDYSGNGVVDAADYTLWRDHQGQTFQLTNEGAGQTPGMVTIEDYNFWKANFGMSGAGGDASATATVPEPGTAILVVFSVAGVLGCVVFRRRSELHHALRSRVVATGLAATALAFVAANSALATVTVDALLQFGDGAGENGADGVAVGSQSSTGATFDDVGPSGFAYRDLLPLSNGGGLPVYENLSTLVAGPNGVSRSGLGILFDGTDDYLSGNALAFPPTTVGGINRATTPAGVLNYNGIGAKGLQVWVYPHSGATAAQHLVMDTEEFGLRINGAGEWAMVYNEAEIDSNVPVVFNQWAHAMVAIPQQVSPYKSVLYVDGVAIAARESNYTTDADVINEALIVGSNTNDINTNGTAGTPATAGAANFYRGVLDNLEMFVWGQRFDTSTGTFADMGTFDLGEDNDYVASHWSGMLGDIAGGTGGNVGNGALNQADINALVSGWGTRKLVNNIQVGDLQTLAAGDLNFDGITDLVDVNLMIDVLPGAGGGSLDTSALFALAAGVPEPSTLVLVMLGMGMLCGRRRHTIRSR